MSANRIICLLVVSLIGFSCQKNAAVQTEIIETRPAELKANSIKVNDQILGFYSAVPIHYAETKQNYPLIVWIHGNGQIGDGSTDLHRVLFGGIPKLLDDKLFPPSFFVNGKHFSFIVLAPQFLGWPGNNQLQSFIEYAKDHYRIDESRIYLAGLSMGGIITADFSAVYSAELAAAIPISGVSLAGDIPSKCSAMVGAVLPVWVFQNTGDDVFNVENARKYISIFNGLKPRVPARYTEFLPYGENGHDAWTTATNPNYREDGKNIYEWMLQYTR